MEDQKDAGDKQLDKTGDSKAGDSAAARSQAQEGMKDLSESTKDYYQARKDGMRDKHTSEIFGAQPQFIDSSKDDGNIKQGKNPGDMWKQAPPGDKQGAEDILPKAGTGDPKLSPEQIQEAGKKISEFAEKAKQFVKDHPEVLAGPMPGLPPLERPPEQKYDELKQHRAEKPGPANAHDAGEKKPGDHGGDGHPDHKEHHHKSDQAHHPHGGHHEQHHKGDPAHQHHGDAPGKGHEEPGRHMSEVAKHIEMLSRQVEQIAQLHPELLSPAGMNPQQLEQLTQQMSQMAEQMQSGAGMLGPLGANPLDLDKFSKQVQDLSKSLPQPAGQPGS